MSESNFQSEKDDNFNDCASIASSVSSNESFRQRLPEKIAFSKFRMLGGNIVAVGASQVVGEKLPRKEEAICDILTLLRKFCN